MKSLAHFSEALGNLRSAKMRSFLAILGVLVGTASVVALVSGGQLATEHALSQFKALGTDLLSITVQDMGHRQQSESADKLTAGQVDAIMRLAPDIKNYAPYVLDFSSLQFETKKLRGSVVGVTETIPDIIKLKVKQGRFIADLDHEARYCVLGKEVANTIQKSTLGPVIGNQIKIGKEFFTIIGTLEYTPENMFFMVDTNAAVFVPIDAAERLNKYASINNIVMRLQPEANINQLRQYFNQSFHEIFPKKKLFYRSPQEIIESLNQQSQTFTLLLGFIGSIALIVGGIGVMNIMLVSVVERKREIGVRMAVGARRRDIQFMFLTESIALTLFGGLFGVIVGELAAFFIAQFSGWAFHLYLLPALVGFTVSALVGMFFGFYPAYKAARLDPILCLRSD